MKAAQKSSILIPAWRVVGERAQKAGRCFLARPLAGGVPATAYAMTIPGGRICTIKSLQKVSSADDAEVTAVSVGRIGRREKLPSHLVAEWANVCESTLAYGTLPEAMDWFGELQGGVCPGKLAHPLLGEKQWHDVTLKFRASFVEIHSRRPLPWILGLHYRFCDTDGRETPLLLLYPRQLSPPLFRQLKRHLRAQSPSLTQIYRTSLRLGDCLVASPFLGPLGDQVASCGRHLFSAERLQQLNNDTSQALLERPGLSKKILAGQLELSEEATEDLIFEQEQKGKLKRLSSDLLFPPSYQPEKHLSPLLKHILEDLREAHWQGIPASAFKDKTLIRSCHILVERDLAHFVKKGKIFLEKTQYESLKRAYRSNSRDLGILRKEHGISRRLLEGLAEESP